MSKGRSKRISTLGSRLTSIVSVSLVLVLLGLAAMIAIAGTRLQDEVRRSLGFVVVMEKECSYEQTNAVKTCLMSQRGVEGFTFSSADEILAQESEYMGEDIATISGGNPYSSEFDVKVRPAYAYNDSVAAITRIVSDMPGVSRVTSESAVIEGVDNMMRKSTVMLGILALLLLVVAIALIGNTVSLSVYGRRFIIHTMKLVGATPGFIRRPFVVAGIRDGAIAGIVASAACVGLWYYATRLDAMAGELISWHDLTVTGLAMVLIGALLTSLTAMIAANRYLKASYNEMFLK